MKTLQCVMVTFLAAGFLSACGGGGDGSKDKCNSPGDCSDGYLCNPENPKDIASQGTCMKVSTRGDYKGQFMCSTQEPCPKGQWCFNGFCAPGCMTDNDCASNQYCDTRMEQSAHMCVNKEVSGCTDDNQCAENQTCVMGLCSASAEKKQCTPRPDAQDGCDTYSVCLDVSDLESEKEEFSCVTFPPCPQDGVCPVGQVGSVCNDGDIPGKAAICLTGLCKSVTNCPGNFKCILLTATLGMCSNGGMGMPCKASPDCMDGLACTGAMPGIPGFCMPGGGGGCESAGGTCVSMMSGCPDGKEIDGTKQCASMTDLCCR